MCFRFPNIAVGLVFCLLAAATAFGQTASSLHLSQLPAEYMDDSAMVSPAVSPRSTSYGQQYVPSEYDSKGCLTGGCQDGSCSTAIGCGGPSIGYMQPVMPSQLFLCGWIQQGVTLVPGWEGNRDDNAPFRYTSSPNNYLLNQLYLSMGRKVNNYGCNWDFGGRVDFMYGSDYLNASALGLETGRGLLVPAVPADRPATDPFVAQNKWNGVDSLGALAKYGLAMPQAYAEFFAPIHYGLTAKFGHFYSPMGYESVMAPSNFFYSHSYSMMYGEPTTLTGMLLSQRLTPTLSGVFGITQGWNAWESPVNKLSYLAGVQWTSMSRRTNVSFLVHTGNTLRPGFIEDADGTIRTEENTRTNYSFVLSHMITPSIKYVIQHDYGFEDNAMMNTYFDGANVIQGYIDGRWTSLNQHLIFQLTEALSFGTRFEWFQDQNHSRILKEPRFFGEGYDGQNFYNLTLGLNWKPNAFMVLRPECRWDWTDAKYTNLNPGDPRYSAYVNGTKSSVVSLGVDLILMF